MSTFVHLTNRIRRWDEFPETERAVKYMLSPRNSPLNKTGRRKPELFEIHQIEPNVWAIYYPPQRRTFILRRGLSCCEIIAIGQHAVPNSTVLLMDF